MRVTGRCASGGAEICADLLWGISREIAPDGAGLRIASRQVVRVEEWGEAAEGGGQVEGLPLQLRHEDLLRG